MMRGLALLAALALGMAVPGLPVSAEERVTLGWGRMFTNDGIGDLGDRWRTGAYSISRVRGPSWSGELPDQFGTLLEFRARAEIIAPESLTVQPRRDRRYAGVVTLGVHTHFDMQGFETSLGLELAVTGPQTGLDGIQSLIHRIFDYPEPLVAANQIPNGFHPTLVAEIGRTFTFGENTRLRPFVEAQAGLETFVRTGFDLSFGGYGNGALLVRETVTGQRYRAVTGSFKAGPSLMIGADVARMFDSALLPEGGAAELSKTRPRARAGLVWENENLTVFYGATWLGKEFETQRQDQVVGSLSLNVNF